MGRNEIDRRRDCAAIPQTVSRAVGARRARGAVPPAPLPGRRQGLGAGGGAGAPARARAGVAVLRFDSRGVGGSGGTRTWMRDAEREDCEAAVRFVSRLRGVDKKRVYAVGYGLGAAVALEASKRERSARGFVGISYPFGAKSMLVPCAVGEKAIRVRGNRRRRSETRFRKSRASSRWPGATAWGPRGTATRWRRRRASCLRRGVWWSWTTPTTPGAGSTRPWPSTSWSSWRSARGGVVRGIFVVGGRSPTKLPTSPPPTAVVRRRGATSRRALPSPRALPWTSFLPWTRV